MDATPNHRLPYIMPAQAQKHVTHNEAIRMLDAMVQLAVVRRDLTDAPADPADGERHIVAAGAAGEWQGRDGEVAAYQDGAWAFYPARPGWLCWIAEEGALVVWNGSAWVGATGLDGPLAMLGINASADATNRLTVAAAGTLFTHAGGGHRLTLNKAAAGDTASCLFQTGWSARAEFGLAGDDDFRIKVSGDGSLFHDGLQIDRASGFLMAPNGGFREQLRADRHYHVRVDGNDQNSGLAGDPANAFATIGRAMAAAAGLDGAGHAVTVHVGPGSFEETVILPRMLGAAEALLEGVGPAASAVRAVRADAGSCWRVGGLELTGADADQLDAGPHASLTVVQPVAFTATGGAHCTCRHGALIAFAADYEIRGGADSHWRCAAAAGAIDARGRSVTLTGTPVFATAFADIQFGSMALAETAAFTGAASGPRYRAGHNASILAGGAGALPGDQAGTTFAGATIA